MILFLKGIGFISFFILLTLGFVSPFDLKVPDYDQCKVAKIKLKRVNLNHGTKVLRGRFELIDDNSKKEDIYFQVYRSIYEDSVKSKLIENLTFNIIFTTNFKTNKIKFWEITNADRSQVILSYDFIKKEYNKMKILLLISYLGIIISVIGYILEYLRKKKDKVFQFK